MKFIKAKIGYEKNIILEDVNLTLKIGELNGIIGKSGVGKSTILKSFFDLDLILEGSLISKDHKDVKMLSKKEKKLYKSSIFYLRPDNNFLEELDFFQNILLGFRKYKNIFYQLFKILTKSQKNYLFDLLKYFNVEELAFEKIANLSSGQKQRLSIVQMFFNEPKIILADEPTSNLDILNSKKVFDFLQKYKSKALIFVAIHDLNNASEFDHIFTINKEQKSIIEIPNDEFNMDNLTKYYHE